MPIPLPVSISRKKISEDPDRSEIIEVKGCFCSFNCVKAYSHSFKKNNDSLIMYLFKRMHYLADPNNKPKLIPGKDIYPFYIKPAPDKYLLDIFGGPLTIEEFRENFYNSDTYSLVPSPMIGRNDSINVDKKLGIQKPRIPELNKEKKSTIKSKKFLVTID